MKTKEFEDIRGEFYPPSFRDPALIPECFALALDALGQVAMATYRPDEHPVLVAEQALRRMVQRAKTGVPLNEPGDIRD